MVTGSEIVEDLGAQGVAGALFPQSIHSATVLPPSYTRLDLHLSANRGTSACISGNFNVSTHGSHVFVLGLLWKHTALLPVNIHLSSNLPSSCPVFPIGSSSLSIKKNTRILKVPQILNLGSAWKRVIHMPANAISGRLRQEALMELTCNSS